MRKQNTGVRRGFLLSLLVALLTLIPTALHAQAEDEAPFFAEGFQENRQYLNLLPFEHIDTVNGRLMLRYTDLHLPGNAGLDLQIERSFSSKGNQWHIGLAGLPVRLTDAGGSFFPNPEVEEPILPRLFMADGAVHETLNVNQTYYNPVKTRKHWTYTRDTRVLELPNGWVCRFEYNWLVGDLHYWYLTEVRDPFGNTLTVEWTMGQTQPIMHRVLQDLGSGQVREVTFGHGALDRVTSVTHAGRTWTYEYDAASPRASLTRAEPPTGPHWQYEYNAADGWNLTRVTTPNGGTVSYTYDVIEFDYIYKRLERWRLATVLRTRTTGGRDIAAGTWTLSYDRIAHSMTIADPCGRTTTYEHIWSEEVPFRKRTLRAGGSIVDEEERDYLPLRYVSWGSNEVQVPERRVIWRDGRTFTTTLTYRSDSVDLGDYGQAHTITETSGGAARVTTFTYRHDFATYIRGKVAAVEVRVGTETFAATRSYDNLTGFPIAASVYGIPRSFGPDGQGNLGVERDAHGHETAYSYSWGAVSGINTPEYSISRSINPDGTVASETRRGFTTRFLYDDLGRPRETAPPTGNATTINYAAHAVIEARGTSSFSTWLDGFGRPIGTTNAAGVNTSIGYDACGRKSYESYPYTSTNQGTHYTYDALDRVILLTHPDSAVVSYDFVGDAVTITDEEGRRTTQRWEAFGTPESARLTSVTDADLKTFTYTYNALGKLTSVSPPQGGQRFWSHNLRNELVAETHPESGQVTYTYDAAGLLETRTDARGTTVYHYDGNHRLRRADRPGTAYDSEFGYDDSDNRIAARNAHVQSEFGFDAANRLVSRTDIVNGYKFVAQFNYDNNDNLVATVYPSGRLITYEYDTANRIRRVFQDGIEVGDEFTYHPSGALASHQTGNGRTHTIAYDSRYRPHVVNSGGAYHVELTYDRVGNVKALDDKTSWNRDLAFDYDDLDRLRYFSGFTGGSFTYDPAGNRATKNATVTYTYDPATGRLQATSESSTQFQYDGVGNLLQEVSQGGSRAYTYTSENQLETATVGSAVTSYRYDADNVRKVKETSAGRRIYLHGSGLNVLTEWRLAGDRLRLERDFIYAGERLLASTASTPRAAPPTGPEPEPPPPPPVPTGRFKTDAAGYCYWEPNESGPNQCTPALPGRYKLDGSGGCYWEQNDTGPDQCTPAAFGRYRVDAQGQCFWDAAAPAGPSECTPPSGRYKLDGSGNCYWHPGDDGPNQCAPLTGRWKLDGMGQCYWEPNDSGLNQCVPPTGRWRLDTSGSCYWDPSEAGPSECNQPPPPSPGRYKWSGSYCYWDPEDDGPDQCWPGGPPPEDRTPNPLAFTDRFGVTPQSVVYSNVVPVTGVNVAVAVSISGADGQYRVCGDVACSSSDPFTAASSTMINGQFLQMRITAALLAGGQTVRATITVGTLSHTWSVRTVGDPCIDAPVPGDICDGGSVFAGYSPDGNVRMYTTPADAGPFQFAWPESVDHGYSDWTTGKANTYGMVQYGEYQAPAYCAGLVAHGKSDWYLPAPYEMGVLRENAAAIGGFSLDPAALYWTGAEAGTIRAWYHRMGDGFTGYTSKGLGMRIRCVRRGMKPSEFNFTDQVGVIPGTTVHSGVLQMTSLYGASTVSISGGGAAYRVCSDAGCSGNPSFTTTAGSLQDGQFLQLRILSSSAFSTTVNATVTVGTLSDTWSVTTIDQDTTPNSFTFTDRTGVALATLVASNVLQITGITGSVSTSISGGGGTYRICADAGCAANPSFTSAASAITNGQYLQLRLTSSSTLATTVSSTIRVGTVTDNWAVTTLGDPCVGSPPPGTTCANGSKFAGNTPDGNVKMYATPSDGGWSQFAWPEWVDHGYGNWTTGKTNTYGMAQYGEYHIARYCAGLVAHGKSDWYLPAPYEMGVLRQNAAAIGGFNTNPTALYWTGAEAGSNRAWYYRMDGFIGYTSKGIGMNFRCVRKD